jgi:hypothetical protein
MTKAVAFCAKPAITIGSRPVDRVKAAAIGAANAVYMTELLQQVSHPHMRLRLFLTLVEGDANIWTFAAACRVTALSMNEL